MSLCASPAACTFSKAMSSSCMYARTFFLSFESSRRIFFGQSCSEYVSTSADSSPKHK